MPSKPTIADALEQRPEVVLRLEVDGEDAEDAKLLLGSDDASAAAAGGSSPSMHASWNYLHLRGRLTQPPLSSSSCTDPRPTLGTPSPRERTLAFCIEAPDSTAKVRCRRLHRHAEPQKYLHVFHRVRADERSPGGWVPWRPAASKRAPPGAAQAHDAQHGKTHLVREPWVAFQVQYVKQARAGRHQVGKQRRCRFVIF